MSRYPIVILAAAATGTPLTSCGSNVQPLSVTNFYPIGATERFCGVFGGTISESRGLLDTALPQMIAPGDAPGFMVGVQITSQLGGDMYQPCVVCAPPVSDDVQLDTLVATYQFTSATPGATAPDLPPVTFSISAFVPMGLSSTFNTQILSGDYGSKLANQKGTLTVDLAFSGRTTFGQNVSVTPATFTIDVCSECLLNASQEVKFNDSTCALENIETPCGPDTAGQPDGLVCSTLANTPTTPASP